MNVLITSAARKVWLVEAFQAALAAEGGGRVIAADADPRSAALYLADAAVLLPRQDSPEFAERLLAACALHAVTLLVPTRDEELPWFAARVELFAAEGVRVLVAATEPVRICQDKAAFLDFCARRAVPVASVLGPNDEPAPAAYPLFARPRFGAGGRGARRIESAIALGRARSDAPELIVQAFLDWPEFTLDVACDFEGRVLSCVPRRRLKVEAGESVVGVTVADPGLVAAGGALARMLGLTGPATIQLFQRGEDRAFIEVNPRFGGGAALGFRAGADTPRAYVRLALGRATPSRLGAYEAGLTMLRHSRDVYIRERDLCRA